MSIVVNLRSAAQLPTGEELRAARRALGLSQEHLARRLGVSFATVNRWEGGRTRPGGQALESLEAILSLSRRAPGDDAVRTASIDALGDGDVELLATLAIFPATFTLESAEAVAGSGTDGAASTVVRLGGLAAMSLVEVRPTERGIRYALPVELREVIRARPEAIATHAEAASRLSDWCLQFVRQAERGMSGREQDRWLEAASFEADAVGASIEHAAATGDAIRAVELAGSFWRYWYSVSDLTTGRRLLALALAVRGRTPESHRVRALLGSGVIARQQGDIAAAIAAFHEQLAVARASGDDRSIAQAHNSLAGALHQAGNVARAKQLLLASLTWWERSRDRDGIAAAISNLGVVASDEGDLEAAREFGEQALALRLGIGNGEGIAISYENLGTVALRAGDTAEARRLLREALRRYAALDELDGIASTLDGLVLVLADDVAARLLPLAERVRSMVEVPRSADMADRIRARTTALRDVAVGAPGADDLALDVGIELALAGIEPDEPAAMLLRRRLTPREREVLGLVTAGWTSKEIAGRLGRSIRTIEHHLATIYAKVGARGRADAIAFGVRMGLGDQGT